MAVLATVSSTFGFHLHVGEMRGYGVHSFVLVEDCAGNHDCSEASLTTRLTAADVGIALGARGSTVASESADVVIMLDNLAQVAVGVGIAKRTIRIAKQAILTGIVLSVILMLIFATGKYPPIYGAAIQELVDVVVIIYALRAHSEWRQPVLRKNG